MHLGREAWDRSWGPARGLGISASTVPPEAKGKGLKTFKMGAQCRHELTTLRSRSRLRPRDGRSTEGAPHALLRWD